MPRTSSTPTISVVIPCHDGASYLRATLASALHQTHGPLEVIVIDDGSTDGSAAIAESFGTPVRVIRQTHQGESAARNRGIDEALGEWIAFLDADDLWRPEKLARQLSLSAAGFDAVHTNYYVFGSSQGRRDVRDVPANERYRLRNVAVTTPIHVSSLLVRRTLPVRFPRHVSYGEDLVYQLDLCRQTAVGLCPEFLLGYRHHAQQQSADPNREIEWHETVLAWLAEHASDLDAAESAAIHEAWVSRICKRANQCFRNRELDRFERYRDHLRGFANHSAARNLLARRIYPRSVYALKDACAALLGRSTFRRS